MDSPFLVCKSLKIRAVLTHLYPSSSEGTFVFIPDAVSNMEEVILSSTYLSNNMKNVFPLTRNGLCISIFIFHKIEKLDAPPLQFLEHSLEDVRGKMQTSLLQPYNYWTLQQNDLASV